MPRKVSKEDVSRPVYLDSNGQLVWEKVFKHQPKQTELLQLVARNGGTYLQTRAPQCLSTGGIRSGKTTGVLMYFIQHYCMKFAGCDILVLRRTFKDLESGAIADFKTFMPKELYNYDQTKHIATLHNGSRVVFGHCQNNKDRDIEQYLGQAYPAILVDEAGQFSPDAWMMLYSRNTINASCKPDEFGNFPKPCIWGCTNPLGPFYEFYRTVFVQKMPWLAPEDARKDDTDGTWWVPEAGQWRLVYNPNDYAYNRTTVLDNLELLKRDPAILARLNSMPKAKRDKLLLGLDGGAEGQYFDVWEPGYHVINLREDPDQIIWQSHQPVWIGQDWGMGHANTVYFFTRAMVSMMGNNEYSLKTVCFGEAVVTGGKTAEELANIIIHKAKLPNGNPVTVKSIFFSHEKFSRQVTAHSPADDYSRALRKVGLPGVAKATQDRIGSASLMYNMLKKGELVILDNCKEIIAAIPSLMRNPDVLDDVLKVDSKGDDCYDGFRYGLYGQLAAKKAPDVDAIYNYAKTLDPLAAHFYKMKKLAEVSNSNTPFIQNKIPVWQGKMNQ